MKLLNEFRRMVAVYVLIVVYWLTPKRDIRTLRCIFETSDAMSASHEDWS